MSFDHYINSGGRKLRLGYTTGTCAALAAMGAAELCLTGRKPGFLSLLVPKGLEVTVRPDDMGVCPDGRCFCAVRKDGGDDKDATSGLLVYAYASVRPGRGSGRVFIDGGKGIGRVTKPGLDQPVGAAAINSVPRQMITRCVRRIMEEQGSSADMDILIEAPDGEQAAARTFNRHLGIVGGISIIGTSGIVEPMSLRAYSDAVCLEIRQKAAEGHKRLILTPGNYGLEFLRTEGYIVTDVPVVVCSNFIGDALDQAVTDGFTQLLLTGHVGKLVKLAAGIMNTHSSVADGRKEIFTAYAALCGADTETCLRLMDAATTDACIDILKQAGLHEEVLSRILREAGNHLRDRAGASCQTGMIMFSRVHGRLGCTPGTEDLLKSWYS